jgi:protein involved in polysaccharide export with SLBB domain
MFRIRHTSLAPRLATALALLFLSVTTPALAQSPEQLEAFQNMSPDQQRAVLDAMGGQGTTGRGRTGVRTDRELEFPQTVRQRGERRVEEDEDGYAEEELPGGAGVRRVPRLKADDTILLNLEIKEFQDQLRSIDPTRRTEDAAAQPRIPGSSNVQVVVPSQQQGASQPGANAAQGDRERIERTEEAKRRLGEIRDRIHRRNPHRLDKWGILNIPELGPIPLAGLTAEEATRRVAAEQTLVDFDVAVTRLPLKPVGTDALKPFGYDLFSGIPSTFAPATDVPVPSEYVVGPGDMIEVQLIGNTKGRYSLAVGRDGRINFPELGPIAVSGRRFEEVRQDLEARVRDQMIGTQASIGIGELRSVRVFVLGDAEMPGSYTVSGLSTITNALFYSGGVKKIGSLRNIQLKRDGRTVTTLDLYDLLLRGDTSGDARLLPGDVIFIPSIGRTAGISGEVRRPAIYELKTESTVEDLVALAGGLTPQADTSLATLERVNDSRQRVTLNVALDSQGAAKLSAGDVLRVPAIRPVLEDSVTVRGHVYRPGEFQYRPGIRIADVIRTIDELKPNADQSYILVRRELPPDRRITVFSANLGEAIANPNSAANFELAPRDQVHVFDLESGRDRIIEPLMRELHLQSHVAEPTREVSVAGRVKVPGRYPLEPGMRLGDLLRAGGGLSEAAYGGKAELTRYTIGDNDARTAELIEVDLRAALEGDAAANIPLQPFDYVVIKEVPLWASQEEVEIGGEVRFPGRYPIRRGETLRSLLERAGGLTDFAFAQGSIFTRRELRERERQQIEMLADRMQSDLVSLSLQATQSGGSAGEALTVGQSLLTQLRSTEPVGRLVIDVDRSMRASSGSGHDVILKGGDRLLIPRVTQEVTVMGEVQSTTSHLHNPTLSRGDYINMSGGLTPRGDDDHIYVVRANGSVEARGSNSWFSRGGVEIQPGDTIVVPLDTERMRPLPFWQAVTSIVYNLAISAAAVSSF